MSIAKVQQFLDNIHQLEARGESESAKRRVLEESQEMFFLAHGRPDLLNRLEALRKHYVPTIIPIEGPGGGTGGPQKVPREPNPPIEPVPIQLTYEQFVTWAREMAADGRLEYGLRFLEMAGSIRTLDKTDALLAEELTQRIEAAEKAGGYEEATVLVVGQPSSGKSVMLGALWRFLNSHGNVARVSIHNSHRSSIKEFYERIMDNKMDSGVFPPGTPPRYNEPIAEFVVDIEPLVSTVGWLKSRRTLPKVRLRLVDIAGEQFSSMGDFTSGDVDPFVTNFLYTVASRIVILFVIDKDVITRNQEHQVDRYFTLVRNFMQTKGMDLGSMGTRVGLVLTKWDKYVDGVEQDPAHFVRRFPSSLNVFPNTSDARIFTFTVGKEYSSAERARLKKDFDWDPAKAEVLARKLYRSVSGVEDDPWVGIPAKPSEGRTR